MRPPGRGSSREARSQRAGFLRSPWFGRFGRQLAREIARNTGLALLSGIALFVAIDFVEAGNMVKDENASFSAVLRLELFNLPLVIQEIGHLAAVIGASTATAALLRRGEVVAMFSAGAAPSVLMKPAFVTGLCFALAYGAMTEWIIPPARAEVSALRRELGLPDKDTELLRRHQTWFRGRREIYRVRGMEDEEGRVLAGVTILDIEDGRLRDRWELERLVHRDGRWIGEGILRRKLEGDALSTSRLPAAPLELIESPADFVRSIGAPDRMRYGALRSAVDARERLGQPAVEHRLEMYRRHAHPLALWCAVMLAVAAAIRISRKPSLAAALGVGACLGFGLWLADEIGLALGSTSALSPVIASHAGLLLVALAAMTAGIRAFRRGVSD
jgi:LPS export ABC transporter permease LptG